MNDPLDEFRSAAEPYCEVVEAAAAGDDDVYGTILQRLASLYAAAVRLPRVGPETEDDLPDRPTTEDEAALIGRLSALFEPRDFYWSVEPDEARPKKNVLGGTVSEDLASVCRDVKQGLLAWDASPKDDVIWEWSFGFDHHWGRHAVDALAVLHKRRLA